MTDAKPANLAGEWVLGVDGGGTNTRLALASRDGRVVGPFLSQGANPHDEPAWQDVLRHLLARAPLGDMRVAHATLGLAGHGDDDATSAELEEFVTANVPLDWSCDNDVAIAFYGAFLGASGVLVLAGTGSMGWGQTADGKRARAGGLGPDLGDGGSGHWLGRRAVRALGKSLDGLEPSSAFTAQLAASLGVRAAPDLVTWVRSGNPRALIASVARHVERLANEGDPRARELIQEAATQLADHARAVRDRLGMARGERVSLAGGLFGSALIVDAVLNELGSEFTPTKPAASPLAGALLHAADSAGWARNEQWLDTVEGQLTAGLTKVG